MLYLKVYIKKLWKNPLINTFSTPGPISSGADMHYIVFCFCGRGTQVNDGGFQSKFKLAVYEESLHCTIKAD